MNWNLIATPVVAALVGLALGYAAARWVGPWLGWLLAAAGLGGAAALWLASAGQPGMAGLGYFVVALMIAAPAGLAAALGTVIALIGAARDR
jgi:hypothetical protein